jgi:hypothetical protein
MPAENGDVSRSKSLRKNPPRVTVDHLENGMRTLLVGIPLATDIEWCLHASSPLN